MLNAILIDDEENCLKMLQWELQNSCPEVKVVALCNNGKEGLKAIKEHQPDIVFLDIEMPYMNGFEMLELVPTITFEVVFTTAYDKYAIKAFKISAVDYLLKPIDEIDLKNAVQKIKTRRSEKIPPKYLNFLKEQMEDVRQNNIKNIALPTMEGLIFVSMDSIIYCQSDNSYTKIFLRDEKSIFISKTLREMEELLETANFVRVHNSFIANLDQIKKYIRADGGYLVMSNGDEVKVSRNKKEDLLKRFSN